MDKECLELEYYPCAVVLDGVLYRSARTAIMAQGFKDKLNQFDIQSVSPNEAWEFKEKNPWLFEDIGEPGRAYDIFKANCSKFKPGVFPMAAEMLEVLLATPDDYFDTHNKDFDKLLNATSLLAIKRKYIESLTDIELDAYKLFDKNRDVYLLR